MDDRTTAVEYIRSFKLVDEQKVLKITATLKKGTDQQATLFDPTKLAIPKASKLYLTRERSIFSPLSKPLKNVSFVDKLSFCHDILKGFPEEKVGV